MPTLSSYFGLLVLFATTVHAQLIKKVQERLIDHLQAVAAVYHKMGIIL